MNKIVAVFSAAVLSLGLLTACGGSDEVAGETTGSVDIDRWIEDYAAATTEPTTMHVSMSMEWKYTSDSEDDWSMTVEGDVDLRDPANPKAVLSVEGDGRSGELITVDGKTYTREGAQGRWTEDTDEGSGDLAEQLNPRVMAEQQKADITDVEAVGTEKVAGVETTHYVVTYGTVETDLWLDDQMRMVKSFAVVDVGSSSTTAEALFTDYGKDVSIKAPR